MNEYRVKVSYNVSGVFYINVQATCENDAEQLARIDADSVVFDALHLGDFRITNDIEDIELIIEDV